MKKGFLTIAYGEYYHKLAENLLLSYRINVPAGRQLPFAVVAEEKTPHISGFDDIIVRAPQEVGFMNKLMIEELSPYDETIFIDADCLVYGDISIFFEKYEETGAPFSSFGRNIPQKDVGKINNILFDIDKIKPLGKIGGTVPHFNAATYYCTKGSGVCKTAQTLYHQNADYGYPFWGDEPYIALAMWLHDCECCTYEGSVYFGSHAKILDADILKPHFDAITYGRKCSAPLLHWSTMKTHSPLYKREVCRLKKFAQTGEIYNPPRVAVCLYSLEYFGFLVGFYCKAYLRAFQKRIRSFFDA